MASFVLVTTVEGGGKYLITSAFGTIGGSPITVLAPNSLGNDNLLFFPPKAGPTDNYFDSKGWAYSLTSIPSGVNAACTSSTLCTNTVGAFKADFTLDSVTPVPLPAALPLFATGLGAMGLLGWRRKRKAATIG
jgi:hypothetical protein